MEFSTTKITPNDNVKIPSMNGNNAGYMETDELKEYVNDGLITQSITDGDTEHAPSGDAVNGALNAIMTESSNSIKFRDGTMLYWDEGSFSPTQVGINHPSLISLPSGFVYTFSCFVSCYQESMAGAYVSNTSVSNASLDLYFYCPSASYTVHYTYLVIGRWK